MASNPEYPTETLYVSQEQFARMYQVIADNTDFLDKNGTKVAGALQREFGLKPYTNYIVRVVRDRDPAPQR